MPPKSNAAFGDYLQKQASTLLEFARGDSYIIGHNAHYDWWLFPLQRDDFASDESKRWWADDSMIQQLLGSSAFYAGYKRSMDLVLDAYLWKDKPKSVPEVRITKIVVSLDQFLRAARLSGMAQYGDLCRFASSIVPKVKQVLPSPSASFRQDLALLEIEMQSCGAPTKTTKPSKAKKTPPKSTKKQRSKNKTKKPSTKQTGGKSKAKKPSTNKAKKPNTKKTSKTKKASTNKCSERSTSKNAVPTVAALRQQLKKLGLSSRGIKADLCARLDLRKPKKF